MEVRRQKRYRKLVKAHMHAASAAVLSVSSLPGVASSFAATRAMTRFLNNEDIPFHAIIEPAQDAARAELDRRPSTHVLLLHDWTMCNYNTHTSKKDRLKRSHANDLGYELGSALLVDTLAGDILGPMELRLRTDTQMLSTRPDKIKCPPGHVDEVLDVMKNSQTWELNRKIVHVIDREGDSVGHFRQWAKDGHQFLVRADEKRTVMWQEKEQPLQEVVKAISSGFQAVLDPSTGKPKQIVTGKVIGHIEVVSTTISLHRPAKKTVTGKKTANGNKKKVDVAGEPLKVRLVVTRVVDDNGQTLTQWILFSNVPEEEVSAATLGQWYAWRWRIETFHKLLKSSGMNLEEWQQETGEAILRRLCVAVMACVTVWHLQRDKSDEAVVVRKILVRLSGRQMKYKVESTAPALLAGLEKLLAIDDLMQTENIAEILQLARKVLPHLFRTG